ncbi:MAG TPA: phage holin family protein [Patescibacteria group bacterium]|nr:phage holin family protein [Patescibacteria group bacterium]
MNILVSLTVSSLAILITSYLLPGIHIGDFLTAVILAVILGIINTVLKPILVIFTLPINILSLGLFTLVINAFLILLAAKIVSGFYVDGFWWALLFSIVLSIINSFLNSLAKKN